MKLNPTIKKSYSCPWASIIKSLTPTKAHGFDKISICITSCVGILSLSFLLKFLNVHSARVFFRIHEKWPIQTIPVLNSSSRRLGRRKIVTLKTFWRRVQDMSWRRPQDVLKTNKCLLGIDICLLDCCYENGRKEN